MYPPDDEIVVLNFLLGVGFDHRKRRIEDVWNFTDHQLEVTHDYIQWLFPLMEPSSAVANAPVITFPVVQKIRASGTAQTSLVKSTERMLKFYSQNNHWITESDHNHLRITRILKSLNLLTEQGHAANFYKKIESFISADGNEVSSVSRSYWSSALAKLSVPD